MLLILECKPDEKLAMALGIARKQIRHQNDKGQVCNFLKKSTGNIGLIDEDPNSAQPKYLANCTIISSQWNIKELSDRSGNVILIVSPRLEEWICQACLYSQIDLGKFGLPLDPKQLHKEVNHKLPKFGDLVTELLTSKSPHLVHLKNLLKQPAI